MKGCYAVLFVSILAFAPTQAQTSVKATLTQSSQARVDKKAEREIRKAEEQFGQAIRKRDAAALDRMLAEYYSDAFEGSERAVSKSGTLARCKAGTLSYYKIEAERKLTARVELIQVEGVAKMKQQNGRDNEAETEIRVKRLWTKKDGRWVLVAQTIEPIDSESKN